MKQPITITLAEQPYEIAQLTLQQLRDLNVGVAKAITGTADQIVGASFDDAIEAIEIALRAKYPEMTAEKMYSMPITEKEMVDAFRDILVYAGLRKHGDSKPGEAQAVDGAASTGNGSTDASAQV